MNRAAKPRPAATFKPKQTVRATDAEQKRLAAAVTSAREHAARAGLVLPEFSGFRN